MAKRTDLEFHSLTTARWPDFERLFGPNGACGGCWCMWWRLSGPDFRSTSGADKKKAFKGLCGKGAPTGIIAYRDGEPIGWVAIAPRRDYPRLAEARVLKPIDDQPVWSITCFFVHRTARRGGLMAKLIKAAVDFAAEQGAGIVEAYPKYADGKLSGDLFVGTVTAFERAGFKIAARPSDARVIVRRKVRAGGSMKARSARRL